ASTPAPPPQPPQPQHAPPLLLPANELCVFCRNNKEAVALYTTHILKGPDGRVLCPVLRRYTCPLCGASGDNAHTIKYCPLSKMQAARQLKHARTALGKKGQNIYIYMWFLRKRSSGEIELGRGSGAPVPNCSVPSGVRLVPRRWDGRRGKEGEVPRCLLTAGCLIGYSTLRVWR
uniref:Nanos C2HC-type zinc finger 1 n=1 Tax=Amazona collaria TaxID=241587 RepID=A0A8B9IUV8_9PSIT